MTQGLTIQRKFHLRRGRCSRKVIKEGPPPEAQPAPPGTIPRISRLMALAICFDQLIKAGEISNQTKIARLGHVSRARVTQIMNLLLLAPDIQGAILFLPRTQCGRDPIHERMLRPIAAVPDWRKQRRIWKNLLEDSHRAVVEGNEPSSNRCGHRRRDTSDAQEQAFRLRG